MLSPFEQAIVLHLIGDWILQNDWISQNKSHLLHPSAWIHGCIHGLLMTIVFGWAGGVVLGILHMLIDTRVPYRWWSKAFRMTQQEPMATHVAIWTDQVLHIVCIAAWVQFFVQ